MDLTIWFEALNCSEILLISLKYEWSLDWLSTNAADYTSAVCILNYCKFNQRRIWYKCRFFFHPKVPLSLFNRSNPRLVNISTWDILLWLSIESLDMLGNASSYVYGFSNILSGWSGYYSCYYIWVYIDKQKRLIRWVIMRKRVVNIKTQC